MSDESNDSMLLKVAVFGLTMSLMCTVMIAVLLPEESSDYDYDEINDYRNDLVSFSGQSMLNQTPWVLTHVYTPWYAELGAEGHIDDGWLYGTEITDYSDLNKSANIHLDATQKSAVPLSYEKNAASYERRSSVKWWADSDNIWVNTFFVKTNLAAAYSGLSGSEMYNTTTVTGNNWNYTGYRYVFDPTLPFDYEKTAAKDGSLSLVWYNYNETEGLSGGLDVYGVDVLIAHMTATDIISAYQSGSGYATTYEWDFQGVNLTLSILFDADTIESGTTLMQAWTQGSWSMAISSTSAGNFYDLENSNGFTTTVGSVVKTFTKIFTFDLPNIDNPWAESILWLMCGLPMVIAMLCVTLRIINSVKIIG